MKTKIYIDTSVYNRPFDDQSQPRIWLEAHAFTAILQSIENGEIELTASWVLTYENSRNPFPHRRCRIGHYLNQARHFQAVTPAIRDRAKAMNNEGLEPVDALHLACAEATGSEYFITCDDSILKRYKGKMKAINPVEYVMKGIT